jgi:response regulator of citrate/malate metabolism
VIDVLIVEDDFRVADLHKDFVERCDGFRVAGVALSAKQAIDMNREMQPQLVLLDLYLPDAHGFEIANTLRKDSDTDIIVVSAARDVANVKASMQHGALQYLVKPFQFAAFRERLNAYRDLREHLGSSAELTQEAVDEAYNLLRTAKPELPKGLSLDTLSLIEQTIEEAGRDMTSEEVAHVSGVSTVTARRYLRFLVSDGRAHATSEYGTPGRPKHMYTATGSHSSNP